VLTTFLPAALRTLDAMFGYAGRSYPDKQIQTVFTEEGLSFARLVRNGGTAARRLATAGIQPGTPVAVMTASNLNLMQALNGVAASGAVIVPLPVSLGSTKAHLARLNHIVEDCALRFAVVDDAHVKYFAELFPHIETLTMRELLGGADGAVRSADLPIVHEDDLALIQYTSGSTSRPRGVALTHRNIMAGIRAMHQGVDLQPDDVLCHWLPLSHDMGLFSTLAAVAAGVDIRLSPPQDFIKHPDHWLRKFSQCRASLLVGPNFSYQYLMDAIPPEETADYDLSAVRVMLNGAEPIDPVLVETFTRHFAPSGLSPQAMMPCYGLAEATLAVTFSPLGETAAVDWVDRATLNNAGSARPAEPGAAGSRGVVSCGVPVPNIEVRITRDGYPLPERAVGDIEIRGEPVMRGYYREPEPSVSRHGWFSTGDLGYLAGSRLHVTGRRKEMMILGGQNYYPQDVEEAVGQAAGIYRGRAVAVVLSADPATGEPERIGVLAEVGVASAPYRATVSAIREAAAGELGGASVDVILLPRNALLRTTSGKYQRLLMRRRLLDGGLSRTLIHVRAGEPVPPDDPVRERSTPSLA
jgi:fatty-acyl-CoA synthase